MTGKTEDAALPFEISQGKKGRRYKGGRGQDEDG
jgi:hypothetical protein